MYLFIYLKQGLMYALLDQFLPEVAWIIDIYPI